MTNGEYEVELAKQDTESVRIVRAVAKAAAAFLIAMTLTIGGCESITNGQNAEVLESVAESGCDYDGYSDDIDCPPRR